MYSDRLGFADCVRKDRRAKGSEHGRAKLTETDIPVIRERLDAQDPIAQIARDYGISPRATRQIRDGDTWMLPVPVGHTGLRRMQSGVSTRFRVSTLHGHASHKRCDGQEAS